jgi:hypothetical protein
VRFDPEELTRALATERRAEQALREYERQSGRGGAHPALVAEWAVVARHCQAEIHEQ